METPVFSDDSTGSEPMEDDQEQGTFTLFSDEAAMTEDESALLTDDPGDVPKSESAARIGDKTYTTFDDAWIEACKITQFKDAIVSEENPVVIDILSDTTLNMNYANNANNANNKNTWHIKLQSSEGNHFTITRGTDCTNPMIQMPSNKGCSLVLENITLDGGAGQDGKDAVKTGQIILQNGNVTLNENVILQNNNSKDRGGAIKIESGMLTMKSGAVIQNNFVHNQGGGGVYVTGNGEMIMNSEAIIRNNTAIEGSGGGVNCAFGGKLTMNGGEISANKTIKKIQNGSKYACYGGGVSVDGYSCFTMNNGLIKENMADYKGGGVNVSNTNSPNVFLLGGEIRANKGENDTDGGETRQNVFAQNSAALAVGGDIRIYEGAIVLTTPTYTMAAFPGQEFSRIRVIKPLTNILNITISQSGSFIDKAPICKGENYGDGPLDESKFSLVGIEGQYLKASEDKNYLIISSNKVEANVSIQDYDKMLGVMNDTEELTIGNAYEKEFILTNDEYGDSYVFPEWDQNAFENAEWVNHECKVGGWTLQNWGTSKAEFKIEPSQDYESAKITISGMNGNVWVRVGTVPKRPAPSADVVTVDYNNETISYNDELYEVYTSKAHTEEQYISNNGSISQIIPEYGADPSVIYVRSKRTEDEVQSNWRAIKITARIPLTLTVKDQTIWAGDSIASDISQISYEGLQEGDILSAAVRAEEVTYSSGKLVPVDIKITRDGVEVTGDYKITSIPGKLTIRHVVVDPIPDPKPSIPDNFPDGSVAKPDGSIETPNGTVVNKDGTITLPDGTVLSPDADGNKPSIDKDNTVTDTKGTIIKKDGTIILPGADKTSPDDDTVVSKGEGTIPPLYHPEEQNVTTREENTITLPGGVVITAPEGSLVEVDGRIKYPDGTVIEPDGTVYNTDGSVLDAKGDYLLPAVPMLEKAEIYATGNQVRAVLSGPCAGAVGYDYVISDNINCIKDKDYLAVSKNILLTKTNFRYIPQGTYYVYCHAWMRDEKGKKVFSKWSNYKEITVTAVTPQIPQIKKVKTQGNTVTVTYTKCQGADGYDLVLGSAYKKVNGEYRPVDFGKYVKKIANADTLTVTFRNVKKGTYYVGLHAWNRTSEDNKKVFSPWSSSKKIRIK